MLKITMTRNSGRSRNSTTGPLVHATYKRYRINSASAFCSCWFDLQWWRSRCALLMRPNKVETAVQCSVCRISVFAGFSCHGNF